MRRRSHWIRWFLLFLGAALFVGVWYSCFGPSVRVGNVLFGLPEGSKVSVGAQSELELGAQSLDEAERNALLQIIENQGVQPSQANYDRFTTLINQYPDRPELFLFILRSELHRPSLDESKKNFLNSWAGHLDSMVRSYPREPQVLYLQARLFQFLGRPQDVDTLSARLADLSPQYAPGRTLRGEVLLSKCRYLEARSELRTAVSLSSPKERTLPYARLAESYLYAAQPDSGLLILDNALKVYPTDAVLILSQASYRESKGDLGLARTGYEKLIGLYPSENRFRDLLRNIGKNPVGICKASSSSTPGAVKDVGRLGAVLDQLQSLVLKYPDDQGLRLGLAYALFEAGRIEDAKVQIAEVKKIDSTNLDADTLIQKIATQKVDLPERALSVVADKKTNQSVGAKAEFGEYLVSWGASPAEFFQSYPKNGFANNAPDIFEQNFEDRSVRERYRVDLTQGFWKVAGHLIAKSGGGDLLGRVLHHKGKLSGEPTSTETVQCSKINFNTFMWENSEITELVFQDPKRPSEVGILRISPKRVGDTDLCGLIKMVF